jgi:hypothetical protein
MRERTRSQHRPRETATGAYLPVAAPSDCALALSPVAPARAVMPSRGHSIGHIPILPKLESAPARPFGHRIERAAVRDHPSSPVDVGASIRSAAGGGAALDTTTRSRLEPRLGADLSPVRVHTGQDADRLARAVDATAFTYGADIFFRDGAYDPASSAGLRVLAHETTHTVQQAAGPVTGTLVAPGLSVTEPDHPLERAADRTAEDVLSGGNADPRFGAANGVRPATFGTLSQSTIGSPVVQRQQHDVADAGVESLPGGVVDTYAPRVPASELDDASFGEAFADAEQLALSGDPTRLDELENELEIRVPGIGVGGGTASPTTPGNAAVTPDVALKILDNVSRNEPPFKPELGKGGASWFVTEGNPYVGVDPAKNVNIQVEIAKSKAPVVFGEKELTALLEQEAKTSAPEAEAKFREHYGFDKDTPLSSRLRKSLARYARRFAESRMWDRVASKVAASSEGIGEVVLEAGSSFSKTPGKFTVVVDPTKVQVKGGVGALVDSLAKQGVGVEPPILEAAEALAKQQKWVGRVKGAFRYGGRILIVVAVALDIWKIYRAEDKTKAVIVTLGGWAGATAGAASFAAWFAPADTAGPWAWAAHGVGTLVSGAIGYWIGSETTRIIYELAVE